jgi:lipopolysaccharide export system permease protein
VIGLRTLDRYILSSWMRIFVLTSLGFPLVSIMINLTDNLSKLLDRGLTVRQIALSYVYSIPENMFIVMPAAVLFATVFTVGGMGRHSELTAAKASGQSFHRLLLPVFLAAVGASLLAFLVGEMAPGATAKEQEIQKAKAARPTRSRFNFVYRGDQGWVYTIRSLDTRKRVMRDVVLTRQGTGEGFPSLVVSADSATWDGTRWTLFHGTSRAVASGRQQATFGFATFSCAIKCNVTNNNILLGFKICTFRRVNDYFST